MSARFGFELTAIAGLVVVQRLPIGDSRGFLERLFCLDELSPLLPEGDAIRQINRTLTARRGTVRGMHFQYPPHAEVKLVSCLRGRVYDVAVDLRRSSPTFLRSLAVELNEDNRRTLLIPKGCAHGFQTLTPDVELLYFHTAAYAPKAEGGLNACDPRLAITWPEPVTERSARDAGHAMLTQDFEGLEP